MRKILDIGYHEGSYLLKIAMQYPDVQCFGLDLYSQILRTDTPQNVYNLLKYQALDIARCKINRKNSGFEALILSLNKANYINDVSSSNFDKHIAYILKLLNENEKGISVLNVKLAETRFPKSCFSSLIENTNPELFALNCGEFLKTSSTETFERYVRQFTDRIHLVRADGRYIPFLDNSFIYVQADHVPITDGFDKHLEEVKRVVAPGGEIYITYIPDDLAELYQDDVIRLKKVVIERT